MTKRAPRRVLVIAAVLSAVTFTTSAQDQRGLAKVPAPVGENGQVRDLYAGSYALLVGMTQYENRVSWPPLNSVRDELRQLQEALLAHGFDAVHPVFNLTGADLRRTIEDFNGRYAFNRGNRLVYFFSGHGYSLDDGERGYFVPVDAPNPKEDQPGFRRVALSMQQIATWAGDIEARHALFAFDSCFSGTIFRTREASTIVSISPQTLQPVRQFLSAGSANETVPAQSVFTPLLIRALNGAADIDQDTLVTGTEIGNYVQREVIEQRTGQTPQVGKIRDYKLDQGEIVFAPPRLAGGVSGQPAGRSQLGPESGGAPRNPAAPVPPPPVTSSGVAEPVRTFATDKDAIEETLNEYRRAFEARNIKRLQQVFPSLPNAAAVATAFEEAREVLVGMVVEEIRVTGTEANARVRLNQQFVPKVGSPRRAPTRDVTFKLEKVGNRWLIIQQL